MSEIQFCCPEFKNEFGLIIYDWNDDGEESGNTKLRLGCYDREYPHWTDPINYCPFCGVKINK